MNVDTGLEPVGKVEWGTHFCHFYKSEEDLADTLVPFFKTGLERNEACIWVTAHPFEKEHARSALNAEVGDLDRRIADGQIAIYGHAEWYARYGALSPKDVAGMWLDAGGKALADGYSALRLTGNTAFLQSDTWDGFMEYENCLKDAFLGQRLVALCSYDSRQCDADAVLDVVQAHDFALARRRGAWELVENSALSRSKSALAELNARLEQRIEARTQELTDALTHQRMLSAELSHRVKNTIASVQAIVEQSLRTQTSLDGARLAVGGRLSALARVHDQLAAVGWRGVSLRQVLSTILQPYKDQVSLSATGKMVTPRAAMDLGLVLHELATNAVKHGALTGRSGKVLVKASLTSADGNLEIIWHEQGGPPTTRPAQGGFGTRLIRQVVAHDLRGSCELDFAPAGLRCTIRAPQDTVLATAPQCWHGEIH